MRELLARLRDWLRRDQLDRELAEELQFHQQLLERDAAGQKSVPHAARRRMGNLTVIRESARERWSWPAVDQVLQDIRYTLRGIRRSPGFATAVLLTLGLGIGANAAMFNVVDQLMFRPYPYLRDPDAVHRVYLRMPGAQRLLTREQFPYTRYNDLKNATTSFSQYAAFHPVTLAVGTGANSRERAVAVVSPSFFSFFDAPPVAGRYFLEEENAIPNGAPVAVVSYSYWQNELGGRAVIGERLRVDNTDCTIVGITPEQFVGVSDTEPPAVFIPLTTFAGRQGGGSSEQYWVNYRWDWIEMIVRRKPGVTIERANVDLTNAYIRSRDAARALNSAMPRRDAVRPLALAGSVKTAAGPYPGLEARTLLWVSGVAVIVLLIACANVANLFLARALRRRREVALRLALGVTRQRLAMQSLIESLVFALIGGAVGMAIAQWGGLAFRHLVLPGALQMNLITDWRTLAISGGSALLAAMVTGFAPMWLASKADLSKALRSGARDGGPARSHVRSVLLVGQATLSVVLLIGAGLFVRSLSRVESLRAGYDVDSVLMVRWQRRGEAMQTAERMALRRRVLETTRQISGVVSAAWASNVPLQGTSTMSLFIPGIDSVAKLGRFTYQTATADYFDVMRTRMIEGRAFDESDREGAERVLVVSQGMARTIWPGKSALGQCIKVGAVTMPCNTVIGVAEDAMHDPVKDQPLRYYLPLEQNAEQGGSVFIVRVRGEPAAMEETVRRAIQNDMPGQQYVTVEPMSVLRDEQRRSWTVGATMFLAFGALALIVASIGLYGVISYNVAQRMHELGVRMALGAQNADVVSLVVSQGMRLAIIGVALGSILALLAAKFIEPLLFQQSARDPAVFTIVGGLLLMVALLACAVPAVRAMRADPNAVLRSD